jgi:orotate phosphoribosyltransferase
MEKLNKAGKLKYLQSEIEHKGIYRVEPGKTPIPAKAPNYTYIWQMYLRRCMFDPKFVFIAAELLIDLLPNKDVQFAACEDAGVPLGLAMSSILLTPMLSIKKSRKAYGLLNFTEGTVTGKPIVLVDDLAGSQNTLKNAAYILKSFNLPLADEYVAIINKTTATHPQAYIRQKNLINLFTCDDFALTWEAYFKKYGKAPNFGKYY